MGFNALIAWRAEMVRQLKARQEGGLTDPDSWDGAARDPFWANAREKRRQERGW